jgi:hypothetical protein
MLTLGFFLVNSLSAKSAKVFFQNNDTWHNLNETANTQLKSEKVSQYKTSVLPIVAI